MTPKHFDLPNDTNAVFQSEKTLLIAFAAGKRRKSPLVDVSLILLFYPVNYVNCRIILEDATVTLNIMISLVFITKITISMAIVIGLSLIAERASPRLAGILAGYPHGVAIVLFFIGLEQGTGFASQAAIYAIAGLAANVTLAFIYSLSCRYFKHTHLVAAPLFSLAGFFMLAAGLSALGVNTMGAIVIAVAFVFAAGFLLRRGRDVRIDMTGRRLSYGALFLRALLATLIVLVITGGARAMGPEWSGLFSGFPIVTFPLLLIIHFSHGRAPVVTMIRNYPTGLGSLIVYALSISLAYPLLGIYWGTLAAFTAATLYLWGFTTLLRRFAR